MLRHYTKMVCRGISPLAIIRGSGGLGKTWNVTETLNEEGFLLDRDYVTISGHSTPLELYNLLYAHKDKKVILLDDVSGLLENNTCMPLYTKVKTNNGMRTLAELNENNDKVLSYNFKKKKTEYKKFIKHNTGKKRIVKIKTENGITECSEEHKWFVEKDGKIIVKRAKYLNIDDNICAIKNK